MVRPQVLDHLVGVEDVAPNLVAPAGLDVLALELAHLDLALLERLLEQARLQDLDGRVLVLDLGALVLALGDDAGRDVGQAHGRVGLVDVLTARALGPERVDPDLVPVQLDLDVVVDLGQDLDEGECRLAPLLGVEGADPHEPVDAALGAQPAVRGAALDGEGDALQAGLLALGAVEDLGVEPVSLGPPKVHSEQHLGPVRGLGPAGPRADRDERRTVVVLTREEQRRPFRGEVALELVGRAVQLGRQLGIAGLLDELQEGEELFGPSLETLPQLGLAAEALRLP
jgi:hypothetical protein